MRTAGLSEQSPFLSHLTAPGWLTILRRRCRPRYVSLPRFHLGASGCWGMLRPRDGSSDPPPALPSSRSKKGPKYSLMPMFLRHANDISASPAPSTKMHLPPRQAGSLQNGHGRCVGAFEILLAGNNPPSCSHPPEVCHGPAPVDTPLPSTSTTRSGKARPYPVTLGPI